MLPQRIDTTAMVETPERVSFRYKIAGPGPRALAWGIDFVLQAVALFFVFLFASLTMSLGIGGLGTGGVLLALFFASWFYGAIFETALAGRTPGKLLMGLRVVTQEGAPGRFPQFVLRNLLKGADFVPFGYGLGVAVMAGNPQLRRLGDWVAGTVVVDEARAKMRHTAVQISPPITEEERRSLPVRVELTRDEVRAIELLIRRSSALATSRVEQLAQEFAPTLTEATGVEADTALRTLVLAYARATGRDRELL